MVLFLNLDACGGKGPVVDMPNVDCPSTGAAPPADVAGAAPAVAVVLGVAEAVVFWPIEKPPRAGAADEVAGCEDDAGVVDAVAPKSPENGTALVVAVVD